VEENTVRQARESVMERVMNELRLDPLALGNVVDDRVEQGPTVDLDGA